jgi:hypothetical protein
MKCASLFLWILCLLINPHIVQSQVVVCLVSDAEGHVKKISNDNIESEVVKFEKILFGDRIELSKHAKIRLCFLRSGRVEEWIGPADLGVQNQEALDLSKVQKPIIKEYTEVKSVLSESKVLIAQNELSSGNIPVRSVIENAKLSETETDELQKNEQLYIRLANTFPREDYFADLFYLASLEQFEQKASMYKHLNRLLEKEKDNKALKQMLQDLLATE